MQNHIALNDLLTRDLDIRWFEGVALVQSVCRHAAARGSDFPASSEIRLGSDGSVSIGGAARGTGVTAAAFTLGQMLSDDVPLRLRLIVTQATASQGGYATLAEFSEALAYFERPDGQHILRQLYERATLAPPRAMAGADAAPALVAAEQTVAPPRPAPRIPRTAVLLAAMAAVCATVWVVAYTDGTRTIPASAVEALKRIATPSDKPSGESAVTESRRPTTAPAGKRTGGPRKRGPAKPERAGRSLPAPEHGLSGLLVVREPDDEALPPTVPGTPVPIFHDEEPIVVIASEFRGSRGVETGRLYSRADGARVTPPRNTYPKLPEVADTPEGVPVLPRTVLELTIGTDGSVETVRLQHPPRDVHEFMLLSAAKAWRFEPAFAEGRPVRFLHRMTVVSYEGFGPARRDR